jgi:long-chain acyl-CoA synthetase
MTQQDIISSQRTTSHPEMINHAQRAATGLINLGITQGDTIALLLRNDFSFFEGSVAANLIGSYVVPINWHFQASEVNYILEDSQAKVLIVHSDLLHKLNGKIKEGVTVIVVDTSQEIIDSYKLPGNHTYNDSYPRWHQWLMENAPWQGEPAPNRNQIIYTSGTTGKPKGVIRDPDTQLSTERMLKMAEFVFGFKPGEPIRTIITGPMYHSAPNYYAMSAFKAGGFVAIQERFDAEQLLRWIECYKVSHVHMVPTMFIRLLALSDETRQRYDLSSLKFVTHAAAPCSPATKAAMIEWWGPIIHEYYGGSETGGVVAHNSHEALARPGTVGRPIECAEVRILDEHRRPLPPGEVGEIYMWHHGFPNFSYKNLDQARTEMEHDGLVSLGDMGYLDEEGYLFVCDRVRDMVISGGVNIYPAEIEGELLQIPGVADCAVFGIPDESMGESLCAHIQLRPGAQVMEQDILDQLGSKLARYKIPRKTVFVDALPREDSGKIFKRKIRDLYWKDQGRAI